MMRQPKRLAFSAAARRGIIYVAAYVLVASTIALTPFMLAGGLKADVSEQQGIYSLLKKRMEKLAGGSPAGSPDKDAAAKLIVNGETAGIAAAEMQRQVASLADMSGLTISRMQSSSANPIGRSVALQLELEANGKIEALQKFLYAVESGKPFIFVKDANISAPNIGAADLSQASERVSIRVTLEAMGWMRGV
jgi:hypothetical protein